LTFSIKYLKKTQKDYDKLKQHPVLYSNTKTLISKIKLNPYIGKKLRGEYKGAYSLRINDKHRIVYKIDEKQKVVAIMSLWGHYGDN